VKLINKITNREEPGNASHELRSFFEEDWQQKLKSVFMQLLEAFGRKEVVPRFNHKNR